MIRHISSQSKNVAPMTSMLLAGRCYKTPSLYRVPRRVWPLGSIVHSSTLHFCKRLFPQLEPIAFWSYGSNSCHCAKALLPPITSICIEKIYNNISNKLLRSTPDSAFWCMGLESGSNLSFMCICMCVCLYIGIPTSTIYWYSYQYY